MNEPSAQRMGWLARLRRLLSAGHGSMFRRNVVHIMRANVLTQMLVLASTPLLSRLYTADDFGQVAFFSACVVIATSFATARLDWSIPNAGPSASAAALFLLGLIVIAATSITVALVLALDAPFVGPFLSNLGGWAWGIPVAMVGLGIVELFNGWFVRRNELRTVSRSRIGQGLSNVGISIVGGLAKVGAGGMILALIAASWVNVSIMASNAGDLRRHLGRVTRQRLGIVLRRFRREALLSTAVSITNATSATITIFLIAHWFSLQELGWYSLMLRLAIAPISLVASAIGQSFWAAAAELARQKKFEELRCLYLRTTRRLALLGIPIIVGCGLAPFVVGPVFGAQEWAPAGYVLLAMAPHLLGTALFSPTNHLVVYGRQSYQLVSDFIAIGLSVVSIALSAHLQLGIVICTLLVSLSVLTGYVIRFFLHLRANGELNGA